MRELALHILDLARNSIEAGATTVILTIVENCERQSLEIELRDDGAGMDESMVERATDAFFSTRDTRRWGLGLALFKATCESSDGKLRVVSKVGEGTVVSARLTLGHLDCPPLGNMGAVIQALACEADRAAFRYRHVVGDREFEVGSEELQRDLDGVPLTNPVVLHWLADFVNRQLRAIGSRA